MLERSCELPRCSLGDPPGGGQVGVVLREEGTRREGWRGTVGGGGSGKGRGNSQCNGTHHSCCMLLAFIQLILHAGCCAFVQDFSGSKALLKHIASSQPMRW